MYILVFVVILLTSSEVMCIDDYHKCCDSGYTLYVSDRFTFYCKWTGTNRLDVLSRSTNALNTIFPNISNSDFRCAEVSVMILKYDMNILGEGNRLRHKSEGSQSVEILGEENIIIYTFSPRRKEIMDIQSNIKKYFPKCCPVNYSYNSITHSCVESTSTHNYIKENFIKVGLPNCRAVEDKPFNYSVDGYRNLVKELGPDSFCIDETEGDSFVIRNCTDTDVCENKTCISKCCPDGQSFSNGTCVNTFTWGVNVSHISDSIKQEDAFVIVYQPPCRDLVKYDDLTKELKEKINHTEDWDSRGFSVSDDNFKLTQCYEYNQSVSQINEEGYFSYFCITDSDREIPLTTWIKIVSAICLMLTITVYRILHETKKLPGNVLMHYCLALFFQNVIFTYVQTNSHTKGPFDCALRSLSIIFFNTAAFSWSNVVCYDIWRKLLGSTNRAVGTQEIDARKMNLYLLYGWGVPSVQTLIIYVFYSNQNFSFSLIEPSCITTKCYFKDGKGSYAHELMLNLRIINFAFEMGNIILFTRTVIYCLKVNDEITKINDSSKDDRKKQFQKDKQRLYLICKLMIIMSISVMFEVVSEFVNMREMGVIAKNIQIGWDVINSLQGVFVFIIFICRRKLCRRLLLKLKLVSKIVSKKYGMGLKTET